MRSSRSKSPPVFTVNGRRLKALRGLAEGGQKAEWSKNPADRFHETVIVNRLQMFRELREQKYPDGIMPEGDYIQLKRLKETLIGRYGINPERLYPKKQ